MRDILNSTHVERPQGPDAQRTIAAETLRDGVLHVTKLMRRLLRPIITVALGLVLALFSAALSYSASPSTPANLGSADSFQQATITPQPEELSEVGSTDGILVMGFVIALIIIIPILLRRTSWMEPG